MILKGRRYPMALGDDRVACTPSPATTHIMLAKRR